MITTRLTAGRTGDRRKAARLPALLLAIAVAGGSHAHEFRAGDLVIDHPYAIASGSAGQHGSAHLKRIHNGGTLPDRLLGATSPMAERVELRSTKPEGLQLPALPALEIPPRSSVSLRHDSPFQLALVGLRRPLMKDETFELTLVFERAGSKTVKVDVVVPRAAKAEAPHRH